MKKMTNLLQLSLIVFCLSSSLTFCLKSKAAESTKTNLRAKSGNNEKEKSKQINEIMRKASSQLNQSSNGNSLNQNASKLVKNEILKSIDQQMIVKKRPHTEENTDSMKAIPLPDYSRQVFRRMQAPSTNSTNSSSTNSTNSTSSTQLNDSTEVRPQIANGSLPYNYVAVDTLQVKGGPQIIRQSKDVYASNYPDKDLVKPRTEYGFEAVQIVKQLSASGQMALRRSETDDFEYEALLNKGFETPKVIDQIIPHHPTKVSAPANVNNLWSHPDPLDANLWQNVEFNKFQNPMESHIYQTPARMTMDGFGGMVAHAPSNGKLAITTTTPTAYSNNLGSFLEQEEEMFNNNSEDYNDFLSDE